MSVQDEKVQKLVADLVYLWKHDPESAGKKVWGTLTTIMEFVGTYPDLSGADKKKLALEIFAEFLNQTNSPGPDYVVDRAILWVVEYAVDALCDAADGGYAFRSPPPPLPSPWDEDEED